ncbi:G-protein coupled receptor 54-like [Branchiostoma floridae x Branchiostoma belcheri]
MGSQSNATHGNETWLRTAEPPIVTSWNDTKDDVLTAMAWDNITGNWTTESPAAEEELVFGLDAWLVPMIFGALAVIGLVGNSLVIHIILRDKAMHTATNYFILSLAVTDMAFLAFSVPFTASTYLLPSWVFGEFMCKFVMYMNQVTVTATCITLTAMSVDRCLAIARPLTAHRRTPRMAKLVSVCIWLVSFLASVPVAVYARLEDYYWAGPQVYCAEFYPSWAWAAAHTTWSFVAAYLLPVVIITACCGWMVRRLWCTQVSGNATVDKLGCPISNRGRNSLTQHKRKTTLIVMAVVALFAICWGPIQVLNMIRSYHPDFPFTMTTYYIKIWAHCMSYANSSVNPIVYAWLGENFRKSFRKMLPRCLQKVPVAPSPFLTPTKAKNWNPVMTYVEDLACTKC